MFNKFLIFTLITISLYLSVNSQENTCTGLKNCATCIQNPECAWCSQSNFHGSDRKPLPRCNSVEAHLQLGQFKCADNLLFSPEKGTLTRLQDEDLSSGLNEGRVVPIQPQSLKIKLRMNDPVQFQMRYKELENYPLDLYYLMDGTYSMKDDKNVLEQAGDELRNRLSMLTKKYQMGFGTFVDKTTSPFISTFPEFLDNPCYTQGETCAKPYSFKNHMKLTSDSSNFKEMVKGLSLTVSTDLPEGGFDALMQVMVCQEQIGWTKQARHLIIFATDAPFHYAGDGRLGGVILPHDGNCHLDVKGEFYTHSLIMDYPSMAQVNFKAKLHLINIIFAVTSDVMDDYKRLASVVEGSTTAELSKNSSNIVDLVEAEYKRITSRVELRDSFPKEFFKVRYFSNCAGNSNIELETSICQNLTGRGEIVEFRIEIELIKCPSPKSEQLNKKYRIYAAGVPDSIEVEVETVCDCPCEEKRQSNSPLCHEKGDEVCGLCECHENFFGELCQCNAGTNRANETNACKFGDSDEICSRRGNCVCGQCVCFDKERYSGDFCECDNQNCTLTNGILCAGNGNCICGTCQCLQGWSGEGCACSTNANTCVETGSDVACSGKGQCICGKCQCEGRHSGAYCENCLVPGVCPNLCEELKHCVQCKLFQDGLYKSDCEQQCNKHSITREDFIAGTMTSPRETVCKIEDPRDECVFTFSYTQARGKSIHIKAQKTKECPPESSSAFLIIAITATIVLVVGIILLGVLKLILLIRERQVYQEYIKSVAATNWGPQAKDNHASSKFQNPIYNGVESSRSR